MTKEKIISIVAVLLVIAGIAGFAMYGKEGTEQVAVTTEPIAVVNGVELKQVDFDTQLASAISSLKAQGQDTTSSSTLAIIKSQVLDSMIANELVTQGIAKAGIKASDTDVEAQFQALITQAGGADKFKEQLTKENLTEAQLRENISKTLAVQTYLVQNIASTTVTDAEVKKFYDDAVKGQTGVPPLKDVTEQIKQQILFNKQQVLINDFLVKLRAAAQVTTNLK